MSAHKIQTSDLDGVLRDKSLGNRYSLSSIPTVIVLQTILSVALCCHENARRRYLLQFPCKHLKPDSTPSPFPFAMNISNRKQKQQANCFTSLDIDLHFAAKASATVKKNVRVEATQDDKSKLLCKHVQSDLHSVHLSALHTFLSSHLRWCAFDENNDFGRFISADSRFILRAMRSKVTICWYVQLCPGRQLIILSEILAGFSGLFSQVLELSPLNHNWNELFPLPLGLFCVVDLV